MVEIETRNRRRNQALAAPALYRNQFARPLVPKFKMNLAALGSTELELELEAPNSDILRPICSRICVHLQSLHTDSSHF